MATGPKVPHEHRTGTIVPRFSADQAQTLARRHWGIDATARPLPSSIDQNFRLDVNGRSCVLKISNSDEIPEYLEAQIHALEHLARTGAGPMRVPEVIRLPDGSAVVQAGPHPVWMVTWLEGEPIARLASRTPELQRDLGRALGDLDARLAGLDQPSFHRAFRWDLVQAPAALPLTEHIGDPGRRERVRRFLLRYEQETVPRLEPLPHQVVHNDANDHNVLVRPVDAGHEPCGLLDFGDMMWTPRVCEPAIAMTYAMLGPDDPLPAAASLLSGYHEVLPLGREEIDLLPDLIRARLTVSVTISAFERAQDPENPFVTVSERPAWRLLERLAEEPASRLVSTFERACRTSGRIGTDAK